MSLRGVKKKEGSKIQRLIFFLGLILVLGFLLNSVKGVYEKKKLAEETLIKMQKYINSAEERQNSLKKTLASLQTEDGLNFEIRQKLNVAAVGEKVAVIVEGSLATTTSKQSISVWQKFKNFWGWLFE